MDKEGKDAHRMIKALLYNSCTSCRKTEDVLKESGVEYEKREFFKHRFTTDELRSLLESVGLKPSDVISTRSRVYKERNLEATQLSDEEILDLMVEEPTLLRRPIVVNGNRAVVGHNAARLRDLISAES
jgi:Spx/MgsR family transcriptional regulator